MVSKSNEVSKDKASRLTLYYRLRWFFEIGMMLERRGGKGGSGGSYEGCKYEKKSAFNPYYVFQLASLNSYRR